MALAMACIDVTDCMWRRKQHIFRSRKHHPLEQRILQRQTQLQQLWQIPATIKETLHMLQFPSRIHLWIFTKQYSDRTSDVRWNRV